MLALDIKRRERHAAHSQHSTRHWPPSEQHLPILGVRRQHERRGARLERDAARAQRDFCYRQRDGERVRKRNCDARLFAFDKQNARICAFGLEWVVQEKVALARGRGDGGGERALHGSERHWRAAQLDGSDQWEAGEEAGRDRYVAVAVGEVGEGADEALLVELGEVVVEVAEEHCAIVDAVDSV